MKISIRIAELDDVPMLTELCARVPAVRRSLRKDLHTYAIEIEGDEARYLMALMVERLTGAPDYDQWLRDQPAGHVSDHLARLMGPG